MGKESVGQFFFLCVSSSKAQKKEQLPWYYLHKGDDF